VSRAERSQPAIQSARLERFTLALSLAAAALVQFPALRSDFSGDDYLHLFAADTLPLLDYLLRPNGGHFMALHKLVFLALHRAFGTWPLPFFALSLATHLLNTALLFRLCRALGAGAAFAGAGALAWGATPLHVVTLGWFSVYGTVASLCTTLIALLPLAHAASEARPLRSHEEWRCAVALVLGAACVGAGVVVALVFPLIAALALPPAARPLKSVKRFGLLSLLSFCAWLSLPRESVPTAVAPVCRYSQRLRATAWRPSSRARSSSRRFRSSEGARRSQSGRCSRSRCSPPSSTAVGEFREPSSSARLRSRSRALRSTRAWRGRALGWSASNRSPKSRRRTATTTRRPR
jgi:hypothetical protein